MQLLEDNNDSARLVFHPAESAFLIAAFTEILHHYGNQGADLPPAVRDRWTGTTALKNSDADPEEIEFWADERHAFRSALAEHAQAWREQLRKHPGPLPIITINKADADTMLILANDHRMLLAATHDVREQDMEEDIEQLPDQRRQAMLTIHFLAYLIETLLPFAAEDR